MFGTGHAEQLGLVVVVLPPGEKKPTRQAAQVLPPNPAAHTAIVEWMRLWGVTSSWLRVCRRAAAHRARQGMLIAFTALWQLRPPTHNAPEDTPDSKHAPSIIHSSPVQFPRCVDPVVAVT